MKEELRRFTAYAEIYAEKAEAAEPEETAPTPAAKATKTMGTRKNKYFQRKGLSRDGLRRVVEGRTKA